MRDTGGSWRDKAWVVAPAVVIPWRDEGDRGEALRYALRSLVNLPHDGVLVVGDALPQWAVGVESIPLPRQPGRYDDNQFNTLTGLAKLDGWAYISQDDIVIAQPVDFIAPTHRGALGLYRGGGEWYNRGRRIGSWLQQHGYPTLCYETHLPFLVEADIYLELAERVAHLPGGFRPTVYGNVRGLRAPRIFDPKVVPTGATPNPRWPVWATTDRSFRVGAIGKMIRQRFPDPGPYE